MERLQTFLERTGGNATYNSKKAVVDFVNALGTWVDESLLKRLHKITSFDIMANECTDVTSIKELTICCRLVESGVPKELFIEFFSPG